MGEAETITMGDCRITQCSRQVTRLSDLPGDKFAFYSGSGCANFRKTPNEITTRDSGILVTLDEKQVIDRAGLTAQRHSGTVTIGAVADADADRSSPIGVVTFADLAVGTAS